MEEYNGQRPWDLVGALIVGDAVEQFDPSGLRREAARTVRHGTLNFEVVIIGESHYVILSRSGYRFAVELFACVDSDTVKAKPVVTGPIQMFLDEGQECSLGSGIIRSRARVSEPHTTTEEREKWALDHEAPDTVVFLEKVFEWSCNPRTQVLVTWVDGVVTVRSLHEYVTVQGQVVSVTTETTYEFDCA